MKRAIRLIIISILLLVANTTFAGALQPNQATVRGLSLASSMEKVVQVMGNPFRQRSWESTRDTMYEYPGVNFVFESKLTKIILDGPQASMDNGLKVGVSSRVVMDTLGTDFKFDPVRGDITYAVVIDPVTYQIGYIRFERDGDIVKRIFIERFR